jgi:DNA-directed RNA polymerase subunit RPC12/RpoP
MKVCPECGGRLFVRNVQNVANYTENEEAGVWKCLSCNTEFVVEKKGEGLFDEDAQSKRIN